jgi:hypothetical protein
MDLRKIRRPYQILTLYDQASSILMIHIQSLRLRFVGSHVEATHKVVFGPADLVVVADEWREYSFLTTAPRG